MSSGLSAPTAATAGPAEQLRLTIVPLPIAEANAFIAQHHRHHKPVLSHKFSLGAADPSGTIRGVATVGRPSARLLDDGLTLEVTRVATDGCPNACSALYAAAWRAARAMGYRKIVTYTLQAEPGTSLRAAGWTVIASARAKTWHTPSRPRVDHTPLQLRFRWERSA